MLADLDHFKRINDGHGHAAGDAVLVETGRRLGAVLRPGDLVARVGGEEFLAVLPDCGASAAEAMAQRLCDAIGCTPFALGAAGPHISATISIGVTVAAPRPEISGDETALLAAADAALYQAKHDGRGRARTLPAA
jgi:two-component system cell cycle response regulator